MPILPIFVCGLILGAMFMNSYVEYKKVTPSNIKLRSLEDTILDLKEDNATLEKINKDLLEELKKLKK